MTKKKTTPDKGPSKAYLVSFGDTMTSLLAFFIVLVSLAKDQTGANLYSGTGSFVRALNSFGAPGRFSGDRSSRAVSLRESGPIYIVDDPNDAEPDRRRPVGPDTESNAQPVIDRDKEDFQRFLTEMQRILKLSQLPTSVGETSFDFFSVLPDSAPWITKDYATAIPHILAAVRRPNYRVDVVVWATTPAKTAWTRATNQSSQFVKELVNRAQLPPKIASKITPVGRPWPFRDVKRPVLSFRVVKLEAASRY